MLVGPASCGNTCLARGLGFSGVRAGYTVHFVNADDFVRAMIQDRVDNSVNRTFGDEGDG